MMEKKRMSRTYLIIDGGTDDIFGFFSFGMKCMHVPDNALMFDTICKRMNIDDGVGVAQLFLLGQMIRSDDVVNYHKSEGSKFIDKNSQAKLNQIIIYSD